MFGLAKSLKFLIYLRLCYKDLFIEVYEKKLATKFLSWNRFCGIIKVQFYPKIFQPNLNLSFLSHSLKIALR